MGGRSLGVATRLEAAGAPAPAVWETDVAIVGAGFAGSLAALVLARRGVRVVVVDRHRLYPREFRCEKLSSAQLALLAELGALDCFAGIARPFAQVLLAREGGPIGVRTIEERGLSYCDMVNGVRRAWPAGVGFLQARVAGLSTSDARQTVVCADGQTIDARLVVLATGLGDKLQTQLGLRRRVIREAQSLSIGFSIAPPEGGAFPFEAMTYFGEKSGDGIGYATLFPQGDAIRVNLFTYHELRSAFAQGFRADPIGAMLTAMPGMRPLVGEAQLVGAIEMRPSDLYETLGVEQHGLVLIGDAFASSCPATGTGLTRILTDVRQLAHRRLADWLATPGMGADKIAAFYDDPCKRRCEAAAAKAAERGRALAVETSLRWRATRRLVTMSVRLRMAASRLRRRAAPPSA